MPDDPWKLEVQKLLGSIDAKLTRALDDTKEHDKRLDKVEGRLHWYSGVGAAIGAIAGFLGTKLHA